jgi:flagellar biosynthesis/type III secretory pathway M-ring protein FliF/YscJ
MSPVQKLVILGLAVILLLVLGAAGGVWRAAAHYRPLLDEANSELSGAKAARDNLVTLTGEQGKKLGELVQAGKLRERNAALAQEKASQEAQPDYAAANQLLRERTGGDPAKAAGDIIDQELGL